MRMEVVEADYRNRRHGSDIIELLDLYARDPMGGGAGLSESVKARLIEGLARVPTAFSLLAYADGDAAGLVNCFEAFSTFLGKPLLNIHDIVVSPAYRGLGIGRSMLEKVETIARAKGCCKLTLEVLEGNRIAQAAYRRFGFQEYELDPKKGRALFWQKLLHDT